MRKSPIRQFLTPEVWKPARQAAALAGCRNDPRWPLQPLILTWAMMTWCAGQTDAERFLTGRTFDVRVHGPRETPRKGLQWVPQGRGRLPMTVWWAVGGPCAAARAHPGRPHGRRRLDRLRVRRHALECPAPSNWRTTWGGRASPAVHRCSGSRRGQPPDRGALVLAVGDGQGGRASALARPPGGPPPGPWAGPAGLRRRVRQLRIDPDLAWPGMLVPDPAVVAGTALQRRGGRGGDVPRGPFWYWTDKAEKADNRRRASGSSGWRAGSGKTTSGW